MGLPNDIRLKHWRDFQSVYQQGRRYRGSHLIVRILEDSNLAHSRFGIAVSQKVSKKAVVRNRLKRQIHSIILSLLPEIQPGANVVIVVLPQAVTCKYEHFLRELEQLFNKAGIINHGH